MRLLLLSAGRRVSLIQRLRQSAQELGIELFLVGTEIYPYTSSLYFCDEVEMVSRTFTQEHLIEIDHIIEKYKIDCILPGNDFDLRFLHQHRQRYLKQSIRVADAGEQGFLFLSKTKSAEFFLSIGLRIPQIFDQPNDVNSKCILKEDEGYGSVNQYIVENSVQAQQHWSKLSKPFLQEFIEGSEYTIDVFSDSLAKVVSFCCRKRERVRSGVSDVGIVDMNPKLITKLEAVFQHFKLLGPWNIQCIESEDEFYFLELNPRFSGGAPLSIAAGCNLSRFFLQWQEGLRIEPVSKIHDGLVMMKYEQEVFLDSKTSLRLNNA